MYTKEYLELDPADGAPVHAAEAPGGRALLGRDAGLLEDGDASRARTILLLLGIAIRNVCGLAFEHRSYGHTRWKCLLQPGGAAEAGEAAVLVLGVKELVDVGVGVEEQLRVGGEGCEEVWVLESEGSLHNPVNIVPDIVLALCTESYIIT